MAWDIARLIVELVGAKEVPSKTNGLVSGEDIKPSKIID